jgi:hypothetical protein
MQTIIDYLGYRVVAVPLLPVSKDTLVHGSVDAGRTLETKLDEVENLLNQAGEELFLAEHIVLDKKIRFPGDLEVHQSPELESYFLIELARTYSPHSPEVSNSCVVGTENPNRQVFFRQFRPEFLLILKNKMDQSGITGGISSDVFTRWGSIEGHIHNGIANEATKFLCYTHLKDVSREMSSER